MPVPLFPVLALGAIVLSGATGVGVGFLLGGGVRDLKGVAKWAAIGVGVYVGAKATGVIK